MAKIVQASPSPALEIKTLMRIGYNFNSAIADILDNSITAGASQIFIEALPGATCPVVTIVDNGKGMTKSELINSMRLSCKDAEESREDGDLGRFGSGMKTASFSQARNLTVISKSKGRNLCGATWDIDLIEKNNSWDLQVLNEGEINQILPSELDGFESGTAVVWRNLQSFKETDHTVTTDQMIADAMMNAKKHIATYFHRFMKGSKQIKFVINSEKIKPIDPFLTREIGYQEGPQAKLRCRGGYITIKTHVLPSFAKMSKAALSSLGGTSKVLSGQGLYIYREKRLIVAGGWMGIRPSTNVDALARVQVDIPSSLDKDWSTDVKKETLQLPQKVKAELRKYLSDPVKRSRSVYKYKGKKEEDSQFWYVIKDDNSGKITYSINADNEDLKEILSNSNAEIRKKLLRYLLDLTAQVPTASIYSTMSTVPQNLSKKLDNIDEIMAQILGEDEKKYADKD